MIDPRIRRPFKTMVAFADLRIHFIFQYFDVYLPYMPVIFSQGCYHDHYRCHYPYSAFAALPSSYVRDGLGLHNILNHGCHELTADRADL